MMNDVHLVFYALCSWGAALNIPAWLRLFVKWLREPRTVAWHVDIKFVTRLGLLFAAVGVGLLEGSRVWTELTTGEPIPTPSLIGETGIVFMALAEPMFLRIDEIHAREAGQRSVAWRLYWIGAAVGIALLIAWRNL